MRHRNVLSRHPCIGIESLRIGSGAGLLEELQGPDVSAGRATEEVGVRSRK